MSGSKRLLEDREAKYQHGLHLCIEAGAIEECEFHPGNYYDSGEGIEDALMSARTAEDREAIQEAYEDNSGIDYCTTCDNNMSE